MTWKLFCSDSDWKGSFSD